MTATSYPRSPNDWQGLFIKQLADALAQNNRLNLSLWAPQGPRHASVTYAGSATDAQFLGKLAARGGIAHLLRTNPVSGSLAGAELLCRLRSTYQHHKSKADLFHINWIQNALPNWQLGMPALVTVLGTDLRLLQVPGMTAVMRAAFKSTRTILAPNAEWMVKPLQQKFGDLIDIVPTPFGIDPMWYQITRKLSPETFDWIVVLRLTKQKIGPLFDWGEKIFQGRHKLHLFGPNQENLQIPSWVNYHGATTATDLAENWFPKASGLITLSQHNEGRPQVILEAMASGLPIIASSITAHRDVIDPHHHGALVNSEADFISAIERISEKNEQERIGSNCRSFCQKHFGTWGDCSNRFINLYERLMT